MKRIQKGLVALVLLGSIIFAGYSYYQWNQAVSNPNYLVEKENQKALKELKKLYQVPEGDDPQIATVTVPSDLSKEPFFAQAQLGDKVIVFLQAKFAILYRPSTNKIINAAPVTF